MGNEYGPISRNSRLPAAGSIRLDTSTGESANFWFLSGAEGCAEIHVKLALPRLAQLARFTERLFEQLAMNLVYLVLHVNAPSRSVPGLATYHALCPTRVTSLPTASPCYRSRLTEQMRLRRRGTDGLSTHRWRKADSNPWSPLNRRRLRDHPWRLVRMRVRPKRPTRSQGGPTVRIRLPPPESQLQTRLPRLVGPQSIPLEQQR